MCWQDKLQLLPLTCYPGLAQNAMITGRGKINFALIFWLLVNILSFDYKDSYWAYTWFSRSSEYVQISACFLPILSLVTVYKREIFMIGSGPT